MLSATITDLSGRTLSGQTLEGFYNSIIHSDPLSVGLNCALGPKELESHLIELNRISEYFVSIHPNAGLPNAFGEYDETPQSMSNFIKNWADNNYINISHLTNHDRHDNSTNLKHNNANNDNTLYTKKKPNNDMKT